MKNNTGSSKNGERDQRSPLYTPPGLAKIKKADTRRDGDGAMRWYGRTDEKPDREKV